MVPGGALGKAIGGIAKKNIGNQVYFCRSFLQGRGRHTKSDFGTGRVSSKRSCKRPFTRFHDTHWKEDPFCHYRCRCRVCRHFQTSMGEPMDAGVLHFSMSQGQFIHCVSHNDCLQQKLGESRRTRPGRPKDHLVIGGFQG